MREAVAERVRVDAAAGRTLAARSLIRWRMLPSFQTLPAEVQHSGRSGLSPPRLAARIGRKRLISSNVSRPMHAV